jgi:hypothetical protein
MKSTVVVVCVVIALSGSLALAQGGPSGRGSVTGDPAASSANPSTAPNSGATIGSSSRSGSGTSSSGGSDANGDAGRDKMPNSNRNVMPLQDQHKPN